MNISFRLNQTELCVGQGTRPPQLNQNGILMS